MTNPPAAAVLAQPNAVPMVRMAAVVVRYTGATNSGLKTLRAKPCTAAMVMTPMNPKAAGPQTGIPADGNSATAVPMLTRPSVRAPAGEEVHGEQCAGYRQELGQTNDAPNLLDGPPRPRSRYTLKNARSGPSAAACNSTIPPRISDVLSGDRSLISHNKDGASEVTGTRSAKLCQLTVHVSIKKQLN